MVCSSEIFEQLKNFFSCGTVHIEFIVPSKYYTFSKEFSNLHPIIIPIKPPHGVPHYIDLFAYHSIKAKEEKRSVVVKEVTNYLILEKKDSKSEAKEDQRFLKKKHIFESSHEQYTHNEIDCIMKYIEEKVNATKELKSNVKLFPIQNGFKVSLSTKNNWLIYNFYCFLLNEYDDLLRQKFVSFKQFSDIPLLKN